MPLMTPTADPGTERLLSQARAAMRTDVIAAVLGYGKVLQSHPFHADALAGLQGMNAAQRTKVVTACITLVKSGDIGHALALGGILSRALPHDPHVAAFEARVKIIQKDAQAAVNRLRPLLADNPDHPALQITYGMALAILEDNRGAADILQRWHKAGKLDAEATNILGASLAILGHLDEAKAVLRAAARAGCLNIAGIYNLSRTTDLTGEPLLLARLKEVLNASDTSEADREMATYAMARVRQNQGDRDGAFATLRAANALRAQQDVDQFMDTLRDTCLRVPGVVRDLPAPTAPQSGPRPLFIVGVPRSGTTLLEQILLRHTKVTSIGESPRLAEVYNMALDPEAQTSDTLAAAYRHVLPPDADHTTTVIDKMPPNSFVAGLALHTMPEARVIHCRRHPMASGFSAYGIRFAEGHNYAYRFETIAEYYRLCEQMMATWSQTFPHKILQVPYEALTESPATWITRILDFCDLPMEAGMTTFSGSSAPVRSASLSQVRNEIYTGSSDKWRAYAAHLSDLVDLLAPEIATYETEMTTMAEALNSQANNVA